MNRRNVAYLVALRLKFEKTLFRAFKKLYIKQGKQIAKQYELNGIDGAIGYINQSDLDVQNLMRSFYEKSIGQVALAQLKNMIRKQQKKKKEEFPESSRFVMLSQEWIDQNVLSQSDLITGTSRSIVGKIINKGIDDGIGEKPIAKNIRDTFSGSIATHRARTIARTETGNASSHAQNLGAIESGLDFRKEWIPISDDATRDFHKGISPVGMNEDFIVNGERMSHPNDPRGSAKNVINCRCVCGYDPILD